MSAETSARYPFGEPNRLHRSTERLERVVSCVLGLLTAAALGVALMAGGSTYASVAALARAETADRTEVTAVLLADANPVTRGGDSPAVRRVPVRWTDRDGTERTEAVRVRGLHRAGDRVPVWTAADGRVVPEPTSPVDAVAAAVLSGGMTGLVAGAAVYLTGRGLYAWTGRRFRRAWELEWERIGPDWTAASPD